MHRVRTLSAHVTAAAAHYEPIPEVMVDKKRLMLDGVNYIAELKKQHQDCFYLCHKDGRRELVPVDESFYVEVLGDDAVYGTPGEAENMQISQTIFNMPKDTMANHLHHFADGIKKLNQETGAEVSAEIARKMEAVLASWPDEGEYHLDEFGDVIFWAMIETLFGSFASKQANANLPGEFEKIDAHLFKMLRSGQVDPKVAEDLNGVVGIFERAMKDGTGMGPVPALYHSILEGEPNQFPDAARMSVTAWWGGLGNTLPNTTNTLAYILGHPSVRAEATAAARGQGSYGSDAGKRYITACLKDSLRLCVAGGANRTVKVAHELTAKSGKTYKIDKGTTIIIHFITAHFDPEFYPNPDKFDPMRYLGATPDDDQAGTYMNGVQYAWAPFSGGRHRCSGYALVMEEVPAALQVFLKHFDLQLTEELCPFDYSSRGFGVKFPTKDIRIRFKRCK